VDIPAARAQVIYKYRGRTDEYVVLRYYSIPEKHSALESDAIAQTYLSFDKSVVANIAVLAYNCAFDDVSKGPNARSWTDLSAFIDEPVGMDKKHCSLWRRPFLDKLGSNSDLMPKPSYSAPQWACLLERSHCLGSMGSDGRVFWPIRFRSSSQLWRDDSHLALSNCCCKGEPIRKDCGTVRVEDFKSTRKPYVP